MQQTNSLKTDFKVFQQGVVQSITYPEIINYYQQKGESTDGIQPSQYPMKIIFEFGNNYLQSTHSNAEGKEVFRYVYIGDVNYNSDGSVVSATFSEGAVIFSDLETRDSYGYVVSPKAPVALRDTSNFISFDLVIQKLFDKSNIIHEHELSNGIPTTVSGNGYAAIQSQPYASFYPNNWELTTFETKDTAELTNSIGRLYTAAFGRMPEAGGLNFWTKAASDNIITYENIAKEFTVSNEFISRFGQNISDVEFIGNLYGNVLGRLPDAEGMNFWSNAMAVNGMSRSEALISFANSNENIALYAGLQA